MNTEQKNIGDLVKVIGGSSANLSAVSAVMAFVGLVMPFIGLKTNLGMGLDRAGSINAFAAAGWVAFLTLAVFIAAAASRRVPALFGYRNMIDIAAFALSGLTLIFSWFFNPISAEMAQFSGLFGGNDAPKMATLYPHFGMALLLASCVVLFLARRKSA